MLAKEFSQDSEEDLRAFFQELIHDQIGDFHRTALRETFECLDASYTESEALFCRIHSGAIAQRAIG